MKRILVGYTTEGNNSGINKYLFNFIKQVKKNYDIQVDVLSSDVGPILKGHMKELKCDLYEIPSLKHPIKRYKAICNILNKNKYDIVYSNVSESFNCCLVKAGKKCKVPRVVIHSHATGSSSNNKLKRSFRILLNKIFRHVLHNCCNQFVACSEDAGKWLFMKKDYESENFHVINNTIDFDKYKFNNDLRKKIRKEYGITDDDIVLGNIGNFEYQKNQIFIFKSLLELLKKNNNYKLMLIGTGVLKDEFEELVKKENIKDKVVFTGVITNVPEVLNAMDIFVFPSNFEGFGIVALEAQVNGLPTIISEAVPDMVMVSKNIYKLPLDLDKWCNKITDLSKASREQSKLLKSAYQFDNSNIDQFKYIIGDDNNE